MNTFLAAAAAGLAWVVVEWIRDGHLTNLGAASGIVAGLVAITPAPASCPAWRRSVIGAGRRADLLLRRQAEVQGRATTTPSTSSACTSSAASSARCASASSPTPTSSISAFEEGLFYGGGLELLGEQALANVVAIVWSFVVTFGIMMALKLTIGVRVTEEEEVIGLDLSEHAETAYHGAL